MTLIFVTKMYICHKEPGNPIDQDAIQVEMKGLGIVGQVFIFHVKVAVSEQFLAWITALGEGVRILDPKSVTKQMQEIGQRRLQIYQPD